MLQGQQGFAAKLEKQILLLEAVVFAFAFKASKKRGSLYKNKKGWVAQKRRESEESKNMVTVELANVC